MNTQSTRHQTKTEKSRAKFTCVAEFPIKSLLSLLLQTFSWLLEKWTAPGGRTGNSGSRGRMMAQSKLKSPLGLDRCHSYQKADQKPPDWTGDVLAPRPREAC